MQKQVQKAGLSFSLIAKNVFSLGAGHFLTDFICAGIVFTAYKVTSLTEIAVLILLYNIFAFGLQLPIGILSDYLKKPKEIALLGLVLLVVSVLLLPVSPPVAIILSAIANAMYHVGSGTISLNLTPKKASAPGLVVAPGAIGLFSGTLIGKAGMFSPFFIIPVIVAILLIWKVKLPKLDYLRVAQKSNIFLAIILLALISVCARAFVGFSVVFPWKIDVALLVALVAGVFFGKALGGVIADKFGWIKVGVGALILSIPLIYLGYQNPIIGILGFFLFNFTMPITLVLISNSLPGKPGTAFGLTCIALLIGTLPFFTEAKSIIENNAWLYFVIAVSIATLLLGLVLYYKKGSHK
jgi:MFS transporter, FSR family, fosmidomycin resistance protein